MGRDVLGRPMEILLIEDDLEDAGQTIESLKRGDVPCRVSLVRDGEEAMEFLLRQQRYRRAPQPDLILLDMHLPKKDGREVLAEVRGRDRLANIPVVVLTASQTHQEILEAENLHVESYLTKPVNFDEFIHVVKLLRNSLRADVLLPQ
jgi:two-component system, chemotaxis family, response regulator Rcp1